MLIRILHANVILSNLQPSWIAVNGILQQSYKQKEEPMLGWHNNIP